MATPATTSSTSGANATSERERLDAEDFELPAGVDFDPVAWLNNRISRNGVAFEKLDQHLSSLGTACQLLCQKTSDEIEVAANHLVSQLPSTSRNLERVQQEVVRGHSQLDNVLGGLKDADEHRYSGLQGLAEIDVVKTRVETACSALREVGSWDRKVRDCDQMVHSGNLPAALTQLAALKEVLDAFKMLPEYPRKEEQLKTLEDSLLKAVARKTKMAFDHNAAGEVKSCCEVFVGMQRQQEPMNLANEFFFDLANKVFQSKGLHTDSTAGDLAAAVTAVFDSVVHSLDERWPLLQSLGEGIQSSKFSNEVIIASVTQAAVGMVSMDIQSRLRDSSVPDPSSTTDNNREARAVALLTAYTEGLQSLSKSAPMLSTPSLWLRICKEGSDGTASLLPWPLLREVAIFVVWRPMQDAALALVPPISGTMSPSEAVLNAESNAKRLLQMPATWAKRLETQGVAQLAILWLACVDTTCASYWSRWDKLSETLASTLQSRLRGSQQGGGADMAFDVNLLNECMQLYGVLHDTLAKHFQEFQQDALRLAARMHATVDTAFGHAIAEKLKDPNIWCDQLAVPSAAALQSAVSSLEGLSPDSPALAARAMQALPSASAAFAESEKQVQALVTQCCVQPVQQILANYSEVPAWTKAIDAADALPLATGLNPLQDITAVGEHLFALVPQLEQRGDSSHTSWLPRIVEAVLGITLQKALQIKSLNVVGAQQLLADLEYLQKVTEALGSGGAAASIDDGSVAAGIAAELKEFIEALSHFTRQLLHQHECSLRNQPFTEEVREGAPLNRRFERILRATMNLP
jgi:hypothetical protein